MHRKLDESRDVCLVVHGLLVLRLKEFRSTARELCEPKIAENESLSDHYDSPIDHNGKNKRGGKIVVRENRAFSFCNSRFSTPETDLACKLGRF